MGFQPGFQPTISMGIPPPWSGHPLSSFEPDTEEIWRTSSNIIHFSKNLPNIPNINGPMGRYLEKKWKIPRGGFSFVFLWQHLAIYSRKRQRDLVVVEIKEWPVTWSPLSSPKMMEHCSSDKARRTNKHQNSCYHMLPLFRKAMFGFHLINIHRKTS